jgi:hypothetical protein
MGCVSPRKSRPSGGKSMGHVFKSLKSFTFLAVGLSLLPVVAKAQHYTQTNLVSNIAGQAPLQDPNLQNAWGLVSSPTGSPWWVSNNAGGTSTL